MKEKDNIVIIIVLLLITAFIILLAIKKSWKLNKLSKIDRKKEIAKHNYKLGNSLFLKDILEFFTSFTK
jgi:uncharacterized membrane protein